jgi:hypothetical protein
VHRTSITPTITLIKLSLDQNQIQKYDAVVQTAFHKTAQADGSDVCKTGACFYPQAKTTDQRYENGQFESYRRLGYDLVRLNWSEIAAGLAGPRREAPPKPQVPEP